MGLLPARSDIAVGSAPREEGLAYLVDPENQRSMAANLAGVA